MHYVDTEKLRKAIKQFRYIARPSDATSSNPCTVHDLNEAIDAVARVLEVFVQELEGY